MSSITVINSTDLITDSRAVINTNFSNLNTDKIETSYLDTDTTLAANSDTKIATQKAVKAYVDTGGNVNASETTKGIVEEATDAEVTAGTATGATGAKLFITPAKLATRLTTLLKSGGTGADGALTVTGATAIDLGSAQVVVKNYTSISITGTGALTFTNPHANGTCIIFKVTGNVTITSSANPVIDLQDLGATGGAGSTENKGTPTNGYGGGGGASAINAGSDASGTVANVPGFGANGNDGIGLGIARGGSGGGIRTIATSDVRSWNGMGYGGSSPGYSSSVSQYVNFIPLVPGGGGGGGAEQSNADGGNGGRGGGALYIECNGSYQFTTGTINGSGGAGGSPVSAPGGGGGGAGILIVKYGSLISDTGTYTFSGGSGGSGGGGQNGGAGGAGAAIRF